MAEAVRRAVAGTADDLPELHAQLTVLPHDHLAGRRGADERRLAETRRQKSEVPTVMATKTTDERAAEILDGVTRADDAVWHRIEADVSAPRFFSYDYDRRSFTTRDGRHVQARGAIRGSYRTEIIPGIEAADMSFAVPAVFEVDLQTRRVSAFAASPPAPKAPSRTAAAASRVPR